jgi:TPP-dependent pyruvate/acetoin dehydrogenase alpha subunit
LPPEAGDAPRHAAGLPSSVVPFAGSGREPEQPATPHPTPDFDADQALELYRLLRLTRAAESRLAVLADEGLVRVAPRRAPLREAGAVGAAFAIRRAPDGTGDVFAPTFRAAGALELFGVGIEDFFRDHLAHRVGPARDSGAELHRIDWRTGLLAPVVPMGLLVEVVGGWALGARMRGEERVGVVCDSAGATSTGAWHEGLVFAAARRSPLVLVVEAPSAVERAAKHTRLASFLEKAPGYGLGTESADGGDVLSVVAAVRRACERARVGEGVQLVEIRYGDDDPIERLRARIVDVDAATGPVLEALDADVFSQCVEGLERARSAGPPEAPETLEGVYAGSERVTRRIWAGPRSQKAV